MAGEKQEAVNLISFYKICSVENKESYELAPWRKAQRKIVDVLFVCIFSG